MAEVLHGGVPLLDLLEGLASEGAGARHVAYILLS